MRVGVHKNFQKNWFRIDDVVLAMTAQAVHISYIGLFFDTESQNAKVKLYLSFGQKKLISESDFEKNSKIGKLHATLANSNFQVLIL